MEKEINEVKTERMVSFGKRIDVSNVPEMSEGFEPVSEHYDINFVRVLSKIFGIDFEVSNIFTVLEENTINNLIALDIDDLNFTENEKLAYEEIRNILSDNKGAGAISFYIA